MNVKMPDFDPKKIVSFVENTFSRAVQATEEILGTTEKIELDAHYENLLERAKLTKNWTTKLILDTEAVLTPNPGNRVENYICQKVDVDSKSNRLSNIGYLGMDMIKAGEEFGSESDYGRALIKVGNTEQKLGQCEWDFITSAEKCYMQPLKKFLDGEMKAISNETKILHSKRLDLGVCKNGVKKARSMLGQKTAECDLRVAQSKYDRQADITKLLLEGMDTYQANHLRNLHAFTQLQMRYYSQCMKIMNDLQRELASMLPPKPRLRINSEDVMTKSVGDNVGDDGGGDEDDDDDEGPPSISNSNSNSSSSSLASSLKLSSAVKNKPSNEMITEEDIILALAKNADPSNVSVL